MCIPILKNFPWGNISIPPKQGAWARRGGKGGVSREEEERGWRETKGNRRGKAKGIGIILMLTHLTRQLHK
jgi:hypothetical protein